MVENKGNQKEKFIQKARERGCDEDGAAFNEQLRCE